MMILNLKQRLVAIYVMQNVAMVTVIDIISHLNFKQTGRENLISLFSHLGMIFQVVELLHDT